LPADRCSFAAPTTWFAAVFAIGGFRASLPERRRAAPRRAADQTEGVPARTQRYSRSLPRPDSGVAVRGQRPGSPCGRARRDGGRHRDDPCGSPSGARSHTLCAPDPFLVAGEPIRMPRPARRGTEAVITAPIRNRLRALRPYEGSNPSLSATPYVSSIACGSDDGSVPILSTISVAV
jgi:hypothetical protein